MLAETSPGEAAIQVTTFPGVRLPLGATLAAPTEDLSEVVVAATLAVVPALFLEHHTEAASPEAALPELHTQAAFLEVASRVEADMVVGGIKRRIGWAG
jgi:hypothetical protein